MSVTYEFFRRPRTVAALLGLCYLVAGWLWIGFSDQLGKILFSSAEALTRYQTYKGIGFVAGSALLIYAALAAGRPAPEQVAVEGRRSMSVRMLLTVLVLATALPMAALLGWRVWSDTQSQVQAANARVARTAKDAAAELQSYLKSQLRVAGTLSQRPRVRQFDASNCDQLLSEVTLIDAAVRDVSVVDATGQVTCGRAPLTARKAVPAWLERLVAQRSPVVGHPEWDAGAGAWFFTLAHPIIGKDGNAAGAVRMVLPVSVLVAIIGADLPEGGSITVLDGDGRVLARSPSAPEQIGGLMADQAGAPAPSADGAAYAARGIDGVNRLYAAHRVGSSEWTVISAVPSDSIYDEARTAFARSALAALAILALCGWLVIPLGRRIVEPLRGLERTARSIAEGDFNRRASAGGPVELALVAAGFNQMLDHLPALERRLVESEERNRTLLEKLASNVPGVIYQLVTSPDGRVSTPFVSQRAREMFELEPAALASNWLSRIHPDDQAKVTGALETAARELSYATFEYRVSLPRGGVRHYLSHTQPERGADGGTVWYGCTMDVSGLKQIQSALQSSNERLEARIAERTAALASANEALESFSYSVAHDLRAPLQVIDGFSRLLGKAMREGDEARAHSLNERVLAGAAQMNQLIESFLALARTGRAQLEESDVDPAALVAASVAELPGAAGARITIGELPRLTGDAPMLRQVFANLLSNAVKYSSRRERPEVSVGAEVKDGEVVFHVRDNGAGFDPAYAGKLFSPFHRLHRSDEFEGTGVGLALVRRIVEHHGGRVWAESQVDAGATFYFSLPAGRLLG